MEPSASPAKDLVQTLLEAAAAVVTPDWKALIALIPIGLALLFLAWTLLTGRKFATVGPRRRAPARIEPITPATVHMPGGSAAPILVAFGAGALFLGLVLGGVWLMGGAAILVVTLLVWFREALRDYWHLEPAERLPAVIDDAPKGPPPGVHMPGPSIRPLLGALGSAALLGGLVIGGWVLILAVVFLVYTLIGWLVDFTAEYRKVEEADTTGHLENIPPRRLPVRTLQVFAVLFALLGMAQLGIFPPAGPASGGAPGASAAPSGPVAPPGALPVVAKGLAYDTHELEAKAGAPIAIFLRNEDPAGTPHDVELRSTDGKPIKKVPPTDGGKSQVYEYDALQPGSYVFICSIHPIDAMKGTLTVK
jgi:plastocyanin